MHWAHSLFCLLWCCKSHNSQGLCLNWLALRNIFCPVTTTLQWQKAARKKNQINQICDWCHFQDIRIGMTYHISGRLDCCSCLPLATPSASRFWGQEVGEVLPWGGIAAQLLPSAGLPQFAQFTQSSKFREAGLVCPGRICILGNIRFWSISNAYLFQLSL